MPTSELVSPIVDASERPIANLSWTAPTSGPFFGWMDQHGFNSVQIAKIQVMVPHPNQPDHHLIMLEGNLQARIPNVDAARLMKRLGWKEPEIVAEQRRRLHGVA